MTARPLPLVLALLIPLTGCPEPDPEPQPCEDSEPGMVHVFADGFEGTEGITFSPDGRLFVSDQGAIHEVFPDGSWEQVTEVPAAIGLAWWGDDLIVAAGDSGLGNGLDGVFRVDPDAGSAALIGEGLAGANFVTVTPWGSLLVSDHDVEHLQQIQGGGAVAEPWVSGIPSPNGMAFTESGDGLWVVSTFGDPQPAWFVPVTGGEPGTPEAVHDFPVGTVPDGVAVGTSGALYVAQNTARRIDRVTRDGQAEVVAEGVDWAASLAFGEGADWDECSIYATSLFGSELYRVEVGETGLVPRR
jgi:sugar lactone lactonase YvrE